MTSLSEKNTSWFVSMLCAYNNYFFFNSHISLKSHFPQCLDILSLPLSFSQGVLHCQMPCFSNLQVRMKCFSISDCDPLLAFFFFALLFFLASCFSNSWWGKKKLLSWEQLIRGSSAPFPRAWGFYLEVTFVLSFWSS